MPGPKSKSKSKGKAADPKKKSESESEPAAVEPEVQTEVPAANNVKPEAPAANGVQPEIAAPAVAEEKAAEKVAEAANGNDVDTNSTSDEKDLQTVADILKKMDLDSPNFTTEQKLNAMCLILKQTVAENVRLRDANINLTDQMEKNEQTKTALQKLCHALKTQIDLTKEEGQLKLRDETQKRIEVSENFQKTMDELGVLMTSHSATNTKLKEENALMSAQMQELLKHYEERNERYERLMQERKLQTELFEAKLNKAKLERAEMATDFTRERLELHKSLVEAKEHIDLLLQREDNMLEQIELYKQQATELQNALTELGAGVGTEAVQQNRNFTHFRSEIEKLTKRLRNMEQDTNDWKEKFEASSDQVRKMNAVTMEREKEIEAVKKKLAAMENLNRVLSKERNDLIQKVKDFEAK